MKTITLIAIAIILYIGVDLMNQRLIEINKTIGIFLDNVKRVEVWEKDNVYIDGSKVQGDCALVEPPCWDGFYHDTIKIK